MKTKQVLVWRNDLRNTDGHKVRTGKIASQLAHACLKALLDRATINANNQLIIQLTDELESWITGIFTKTVVVVNSEEELLDIYNKAQKAGLICAIIKDVGTTEFRGVPTYTACAVGPGTTEEVDKITGLLKLL